MSDLKEYQNRYSSARLERTDGILEVTVGTDGGPLEWGALPHEELGLLFRDIRADPGNRIMILTGTGDTFIDSHAPWQFADIGSPAAFHRTFYEGQLLIEELLKIEIPIIAGVNGPATVHAELAVLSDIVVASETATFQDAPHFMSGLVPGDGAGLVWQHLLGPNRGRYFLLMGELLTAREALALGVVGEVVPPGQLRDRCRDIAVLFAQKSDLVLRYTRILLTQQWKRQVLADLPFGFVLEGAGIADLANQPGASPYGPHFSGSKQSPPEDT